MLSMLADTIKSMAMYNIQEGMSWSNNRGLLKKNIAMGDMMMGKNRVMLIN